MGDNRKATTLEIQEVLGRILVVNEEYQRLICVGRECGVGLELGSVGDHYKNIHGLKEKNSIVMAIRAVQLGKGWSKFNQTKPGDGSRPQRGLAVFDGFQCRFCHESKAAVEDIEHHIYEMHRETEGHIWDAVRVQSWGGKGRGGDDFWVVDESKDRGEKATGYENEEGYLDEFDNEVWSEGMSQWGREDLGEWEEWEEWEEWDEEDLGRGNEVGEEMEEEWIIAKEVGV